jgi:hypothetical protein
MINSQFLVMFTIISGFIIGLLCGIVLLLAIPYIQNLKKTNGGNNE